MLTPAQVRAFKPGTLLRDNVGGDTGLAAGLVPPGSMCIVLENRGDGRLVLYYYALRESTHWNANLYDSKDPLLTEFDLMEEPSDVAV